MQPVRQKELGEGVGQKFEEKSQSFCNTGEKVLKTIFGFNRTAKEWVKSGNLENEPNKLFVLILTCTWIPVFKHFRNLSAISFCQQNLTCFYRSELFSAIWQRYGFSTENSGFYLLPIYPRPAFASSMGSAWWVSATDVLDWLYTQFFPFCYFQVRSSNKKYLKLLLLHGWPSTYATAHILCSNLSPLIKTPIRTAFLVCMLYTSAAKVSQGQENANKFHYHSLALYDMVNHASIK